MKSSNVEITKIQIEKGEPITAFSSKDMVRTTTSTYLSVPIRSNDTVGTTGICWAAVSASIIDYKKGTYHTAADIFYDVWDSYGGTPASMPIGTWNHIKKAFNLHSLYPSEYSPLSTSTVGSVLSSDIPIYMSGVDDKGTSTTSDDSGHGFILRGISSFGGDTFYSIMDPNKSSYVSIYVIPSAIYNGSNFIYVTTYGYQFKWKYARY